MKKNNTAEKTVQDAKKLTEALKESTKKSLKDIMKEAIEDIIANDDEEEAEIDGAEGGDLEDSYDVEDVEAVNEPTEDEEIPAEGEGEEAPAEEGEAEDEWSDMEEFKVGDNDYDFTGLDGENSDEMVLKVFNKLGDDDQIIIKKEDDGTYEVKDEETGAEYVIELDADSEKAETEGEPEAEVPADGESDNDEEISIDIEGGEEEPEENDDETKLDEEKQEFTDSYQKKDAIEGLNVNEPADKSVTYSMDGGAPTGTERPYGKPGEGEPFEQKVNECGAAPAGEEVLDEDGSGLNTKRSTKKNTNHINRSAQNQRHVSTDGEYQALKEAAMKIYNKAKLIQEENKKYKGYIAEIKKSLTEAAVLNVSLTQALKLIMENTTSAKEKKSILQRFNEVKTIKESKSLYETIKGELNEAKKSEPTIDRQMSATPKNTLNETTIYNGSTVEKNPSLSLMERMDNLWKK